MTLHVSQFSEFHQLALCRREDQFVITAHSVYFLEYRHYSRKLLFVRSVAIDQSISPDLPWVAYVIIFEPPIESIVSFTRKLVSKKVFSRPGTSLRFP